MKSKFLKYTVLSVSLFCASTLCASPNLQRQKLLSEQFSTANNQVKVAFFDADSTLRVSLSGAVSANSPTDVLLLPDITSALKELNREGYLIAVVSNQGGVDANVITLETADQALFYMIEKLKNLGVTVHYFDFAERSDGFRKPKTGMAQLLTDKLNAMGLGVDLSKSFMVGDSAYKKGQDIKPDGSLGTHFSNSDRLFAENLGVPFFEPTDFFGWRKQGIDVFEKADQVEKYISNKPSIACSAVFSR